MKRRLLGLLLSTCVVLTLAFLSTGGAFASTTLVESMVGGDFSAKTYEEDTAQEPTITVTDGADTLVRGTHYTVTYAASSETGANTNPTLDSNGKPLNAGTYTVTITGIGNYSGTVTKEFKINKANGFANGIEPKMGLYYTGKEQKLITEPTSRSGEVQYSITTDYTVRDWKTDIPKATSQNNDQFYIYYKVLESDNYNAVAETWIRNYSSSWIGKVSFKIKAKDKTMEVDGTLPANEYTREIGNEQGGAAAEGGVDGYLVNKTATYKYYKNNTEVAVNDLDLTHVGTYTIKVEISGLRDDSNYEIDVEPGTLTIEARKVAVPTESTKTYTYTGSAQTYVFGNAGGGEDYTVANNTRTDVGTQEVTVSLKNTTDTMWSDRTTDDKTFTFTIDKAAGTVTAPTAKTLTYTGQAQALVNAGTSTTGTIKYSLEQDGTYAETIPTGIAADTYTVWYKVEGDANHNDVDAQRVSMTIGKANGSVTAPTVKTGLVYTGNAQELVNAGTSTTGTIKYSLSENGTYETSIPTGTDADTYTVWYKVEGDENHNDVAPSSIEVTIGKAAGSVKTAPTAKTLTYTGQAQALVEAGSSDTGNIKYSLEQNGTYTETIPTGIAADTYTVWYKVEGDANHNDVAPTSIEVTISKAAATVKVADQTMTAGGTLPTNSYTVTDLIGQDTLTGTVAYTYTDSEGTAYTADTLDRSKAGTYTITATGLANDNYNVTFTAGKLTINARSHSGSSGSSSKKNDTNATDTEKKDTDATGTDTKDTETAEETAAKVEAAKTGASSASAKARSVKTKSGVKVTYKSNTDTQSYIDEMKALGYTVKYRFYRSTKKSSSYKAMLTKTSKTYTNTVGKEGTRYYYKAQVRVYDGSGKLIAKTELKQCKYATRVF